ncbi:RICIN domain-containing protein [Catenuloplanes japonicus]|uniref:hypothetical protein n=1 Tax=Catenuloplanes japonicus TaxID=33876 RepID=UPI00052539B6|nr:hypothetical protein [Catenuloplanes japonicus]
MGTLRKAAVVCGALAGLALPEAVHAAPVGATGEAAVAAQTARSAVETEAGVVVAAQAGAAAGVQVVPPGPAMVRNVALDACLTALSPAAIAVEPCDGTSRQVFLIQPTGDLGNIMIRHNGRCVRVAPGSPPVNPARLGLCTGSAEETIHPTSVWRESTFVLYLGTYSLRSQRVGDPPFTTWAQQDPGAFQEWRILPPV